MDEQLTCGACDHSDGFDQFDIIGACPGNLFCPRCHAEVDSDTGAVVERCGKCEACEEMAIDAGRSTQKKLF